MDARAGDLMVATPRNEPAWSLAQRDLMLEHLRRGDDRPCKPEITHQTMGSGSGSKLLCVVHDRMYSERQRRCSFPKTKRA